MSKKIAILVLVATCVIIAAGGTALLVHRNRTARATATSHATVNASQHNKQAFVPINISIKNGQLVGAVNTYLVRYGTVLQFTVNSKLVGKIGAPVSPPQTITFTHSPLVFHFTADKPGTFPMTYQAKGSSKVILLATIVVKKP
jgi:hypothetical protein